MIKQDDIIKAEEGKLLLYIPENIIWGKAARLVEYKGHKLTIEDFNEVSESEFECIDNVWYDFRNHTYAYIKTFIVKLHYSNDDQIALMLNYQDNPEKYNDVYITMQEWRDYAGRIAKKYTNN